MADALSEVRIIHRIQSEAWTSSWCLTRKKQWIGYYKRKRKNHRVFRSKGQFHRSSGGILSYIRNPKSYQSLIDKT